MRHEVRFSGFGGQGIILSAVILGRAAVMYDNKYAVQTQVYGPEARGGASMSAVIIDDDPILYPKVAKPGIFVIMSQEGFERYGQMHRRMRLCWSTRRLSTPARRAHITRYLRLLKRSKHSGAISLRTLS